jgi:hypothetical protein
MSTANLLDDLRRPVVIDYDTKRYPFREAILTILEDDCAQDGIDPLPTNDLSLLHEYCNHLCSTHTVDRSGHEMAYFQTKWNLKRDKGGEIYKGNAQEPPSEAYLVFEKIYKTFVKEVVGPSIIGPTEGHSESGTSRRVLYQRAPTFRIYLANARSPMGKIHTDEEYHHQPSELNCWMPISDHVGGSNSLFVESSPGLGDFEPLTLRYGQVYRGYLNQCRHFTKVNDSGFTRVSVDFRVVSDATGGHNPDFHKGVRRGAKAMWQRKYDVGGFYSTMDC